MQSTYSAKLGRTLNAGDDNFERQVLEMVDRVVDSYLTVLVVVVVALACFGVVCGIIGGIWSVIKLAPSRRIQDEQLRAVLARRAAEKEAEAIGEKDPAVAVVDAVPRAGRVAMGWADLWSDEQLSMQDTSGGAETLKPLRMDEFIPWYPIDYSHSTSYGWLMLRYAMRQDVDRPLRRDERQGLRSWRAWLGQTDSVVDYDDTVGFLYVARRPGIDAGLVRVPNQPHPTLAERELHRTERSRVRYAKDAPRRAALARAWELESADIALHPRKWILRPRWKPDVEQLAEWMAEGASSDEMQLRIFEKSGHIVATPMVEYAFVKAGLKKELKREEFFPWSDMEGDDGTSYAMRMLTYAMRLEADRSLQDDEREGLASWRAWLASVDAVVDYSRNSGFSYVPRRPGVDSGLVRVPEGWRPYDARERATAIARSTRASSTQAPGTESARREGNVSEIDRVWANIVSNAGQEFRQKRGKLFTYTVYGGSVIPSTTNRNLPRGDFAKALDRRPLTGPGKLQDLQGPSYIWAILSDARISG